jgi:hypothetical protein
MNDDNKTTIEEDITSTFDEWDKALKADMRKRDLRTQISYSRLYSIAHKMYTWIFLNTADHEAIFKEIGLSPEENEFLGDLGNIRVTL